MTIMETASVESAPIAEEPLQESFDELVGSIVGEEAERISPRHIAAFRAVRDSDIARTYFDNFHGANMKKFFGGLNQTEIKQIAVALCSLSVKNVRRLEAVMASDMHLTGVHDFANIFAALSGMFNAEEEQKFATLMRLVRERILREGKKNS